MKKILVVIDMQNDFIDGALGTKEAQSIVAKVKAKIEQYQAASHEIIFTRDTHAPNYLQTQEGKNLPVEHCIQDTAGWQIAQALSTQNCTIWDKTSFGSYPLGEWFQNNNFEEIELVGLCTDICVISNALILKAFVPETKITVDASCCAGVTPESHRTALSAMKMCQIHVINEE